MCTLQAKQARSTKKSDGNKVLQLYLLGHCLAGSHAEMRAVEEAISRTFGELHNSGRMAAKTSNLSTKEEELKKLSGIRKPAMVCQSHVACARHC